MGTLFARPVPEAASEAAFAAAARMAARNLLLTRLGGGAFGNDPGWIDDAVLRAAERQTVPGLQVLMVGYGHPDPENRDIAARWPG